MELFFFLQYFLVAFADFFHLPLSGQLSTHWPFFIEELQVILCQKLLFLHQQTHNMVTDCSFYYKFNTWKFQAQSWGEHVLYRNCFWHSKQFLYTTWSPHVIQKEELLTKIYLYYVFFHIIVIIQNRLACSNLTSSFRLCIWFLHAHFYLIYQITKLKVFQKIILLLDLIITEVTNLFIYVTTI